MWRLHSRKTSLKCLFSLPNNPLSSMQTERQKNVQKFLPSTPPTYSARSLCIFKCSVFPLSLLCFYSHFSIFSSERIQANVGENSPSLFPKASIPLPSMFLLPLLPFLRCSFLHLEQGSAFSTSQCGGIIFFNEFNMFSCFFAAAHCQVNDKLR